MKHIVDLTLLHGSPYSNIRLVNNQLLFFTKDRTVAVAYAEGKVFNTGKHVGVLSPTLYTVKVTVNVANFNDDVVREQYEQQRIQTRLEFVDDPLPRINSEGFIMNSGLPSYGRVRDLKTLLQPLGYEAVWIDEGQQGKSLAVFDCKKSCAIIKEEHV
jgi:hypothetical protein